MDTFSLTICDDDKITHEVVAKYLLKFYKKRNVDLQLQHFYNAKTLLSHAEDQQTILMDIDMPETDGIAASEKLTLLNPNVNIIMLTSKRERFKDAFRIGATRFVTKPIELSELYEAVESARKKQRTFPDLLVEVNGRHWKINQKKLYMAEAYRNKTILYLKDRNISVNLTLKNLEARLCPDLFLRVHKSFLVNMTHVADIQDRVITLSNGIRAMVSFRRETDVKKKLFENEAYWG